MGAFNKSIVDLTCCLAVVVCARAAHPVSAIGRTHGAFVVFNHEESYRRCVQDYGPYRTWISRLLQPPALRMRGHRLKVEPAEEPTAVLWENLDTYPVRRFFRRIVTMLCAFVLLSLSFTAIYHAQRTRQVCGCVLVGCCPRCRVVGVCFNVRFARGGSQIATNNIPTSELCATDVPNAMFNGTTVVSVRWAWVSSV